jgi:transcriptional regulator with PAS, ATPase and Fis domain
MGIRNISGVSKHIKKIHKQIEGAAKTTDTVLITGPTGTGKELIANNIHASSDRKNKPYEVVNCGGLTATLFESEMFGHVIGAFTDAKANRKGKIASAESGTLFLDEIGNLQEQQQSVLLRFLQDKTYSPVGSDKTQKADVRIICATNQDIHQDKANGKFRSDLYARLAQVVIETEPLKNRPEDVILLLKEKNPKIDPRAKVLLYSYDWPGNVRDLENLVSKDYSYIRTHFIRETSVQIGEKIPEEADLFGLSFTQAVNGKNGRNLDLLYAINLVETFNPDCKKLTCAYEICILKSAGLKNDNVAEELHIRRKKLSQFQAIFGFPLLKIQNFSEFLQNPNVRSALINK